MQEMLDSFIPAAPVLLVLLGGVVSVALEFILPRTVRPIAQITLSVAVLLGAACWTVANWLSGYTDFAALGSLAVDGPAWIVWSMLLIFGLMSALLFAERRANGGMSAFVASAAAIPGSQDERQAVAERREHTEVFGLLLLAIAGMMIFSAANDILTMFVGLEVFSLPLYVMCGLARRRRLLSQEAAMKYFLLGSLSSALFLYGVALIYGYSSGFGLTNILLATRFEPQSPYLLVAGLALVCVGVLFKMGAVPFHNWMPDVYQGAPTPVTAFMAVCTKIAAVFGLTRLLYVGLGALVLDWQLILSVIAVATMFVGAVIGLIQGDVKRLLAYSAVAHAGFLIVGITGAVTTANGLAEGRVGSVAGLVFYLAAYGFATLGAFAIVTLVQRSGSEATSFKAWAGLGRRNPALAFFMTFFLLSMAGIPLTGGFVGKLLVFVSAWQGGHAWLVGLAVIASVIAAGFYFKVIWLMFGKEPEDADVEVVPAGIGTNLVIWVGALATLILGILPGPFIDQVAQAAELLIRPLS